MPLDATKDICSIAMISQLIQPCSFRSKKNVSKMYIHMMYICYGMYCIQYKLEYYPSHKTNTCSHLTLMSQLDFTRKTSWTSLFFVSSKFQNSLRKAKGFETKQWNNPRLPNTKREFGMTGPQKHTNQTPWKPQEVWLEDYGNDIFWRFLSPPKWQEREKTRKNWFLAPKGPSIQFKHHFCRAEMLNFGGGSSKSSPNNEDLSFKLPWAIDYYF